MAKSSSKPKRSDGTFVRSPDRASVRAGAITVVRERRQTQEAAPALTVTATEAKHRFGPLLETAMRGGAVVITKHNAPRAVLLSIAEFEALGGARPADLNTLSHEFDALLTELQTPASRVALSSAFAADSAELGRMAVAGSRRRG